MEDGISHIEKLNVAPTFKNRPAKTDIQLVPNSARFGPVGMGHFGKNQNHIAGTQWNINAPRIVIIPTSCHRIHNSPLSKDAWFISSDAS